MTARTFVPRQSQGESPAGWVRHRHSEVGWPFFSLQIYFCRAWDGTQGLTQSQARAVPLSYDPRPLLGFLNVIVGGV